MTESFGFRCLGWVFILSPIVLAFFGIKSNENVTLIGAMCFCTAAILRQLESRSPTPPHQPHDDRLKLTQESKKARQPLGPAG